METVERSVDSHQVPNSGNRLHFGLDRWRSRRVTIRIAVTLEYSVNGQTLSVPAHTVWVNDEEALLLATQELPSGSRCELKQCFTGERLVGRVSQSQLKRNDGYYIGFRFESPAPGFWHIIFPGARA